MKIKCRKSSKRREAGDDARTPQPIDVDKCIDLISVAMESAGFAPEYIYAFKQTGRVLTQENEHLLSAEELAEWDGAIDEYRRSH